MTPDLISSTSQLDLLFAALLRLKPRQNMLESMRYPIQKEPELMSSLANSFTRLKKKLQGASNIPPISQMPSFTRPVSQLIGANQFFEDSFKNWACKELGWQFGFNRKLWEYAFILNALSVHKKMGGRGLGFGVGRDPIVSVMLRHGAQLVVSDLSDEDAVARGWDTMDFNQEANQPLKLLSVDMNHIPSDLRSFDFIWSCGSLEHIGGLNHGLQFIENAMACLKPGGIAVHTTEFNLSSNEQTFDTPGLSLYRQRDIEQLAQKLRKLGHKIELNLTRGDHPMDAIISDETSPWELNLKVALCGYHVCSVGLIIEKDFD